MPWTPPVSCPHRSRPRPPIAGQVNAYRSSPEATILTNSGDIPGTFHRCPFPDGGPRWPYVPQVTEAVRHLGTAPAYTLLRSPALPCALLRFCHPFLMSIERHPGLDPVTHPLRQLPFIPFLLFTHFCSVSLYLLVKHGFVCLHHSPQTTQAADLEFLVVSG